MRPDALEELIDSGFGGHVRRFEHFNRMLKLVCHGDERAIARFRRHHHMQYAVRTRHADLVRQRARQHALRAGIHVEAVLDVHDAVQFAHPVDEPPKRR